MSTRPKLEFYRKTIERKHFYRERRSCELTKMKLMCRVGTGKWEELGTLLKLSDGYGQISFFSGPGVDNYFRAWSGASPPRNQAALERIGLKEDCKE